MEKKVWEKILSTGKILTEGTWAIDKPSIPKMIKELESFKKRWWNKVGDDDLYDGIDAAIRRLKELK